MPDPVGPALGIRVAIYSGIYVRGDGISTSARHKLDILSSLRHSGIPVETTLFTRSTNYDSPEIREVSGVQEVLTSPEFQQARIHIFEFGIWNDLFDCIFLVPEDDVRIVVYHNVTPPDLADTAEVQDVLHRSLVQKHNLFLADRILCVSEFNRDDLQAFGIPADKLSVLHLPPTLDPLPRTAQQGSEVQLLFVGRFVRAKGVLDLAQAVANARGRGLDGFHLTLVGNTSISSDHCIQELEHLIERHGIASTVTILRSPDDARLAHLYATSDALVLPSYHEGYCLPVVEALRSGTYVITYQAGNLPYVLGGLGTLLPTGDVDGLTQAIADFVAGVQRARREATPQVLPTAAGPMPADEWRRRVSEHLAAYSTDAYRRGVVELLDWAADRAYQTNLIGELAPSDQPTDPTRESGH